MAMTRRGFLAAAALGAGAAMSARAEGEKLRVCIIGDTKNGGYGHDLHLSWALRGDVEISALADPDEAGRKKRAAEAGALRTYADYREMLEKEKPDVVTVGPRHTTNHRAYVLAAAACGAHGFIEKPLAASLEDADAMVEAVNTRGLKWAIAFNYRTIPEIQHTLRLVRDGLVGDIMELRGRGKEDHRSGGEDLVVLGTHIFDLMRHFAGPPRWCQATATVDGRVAGRGDIREATEPIGPIIGDSIQARFGFDGGATGSFASLKSTAGNAGRWGLDICGTKGMVSIRNEVNGMPCVRVLRSPGWMPDPDKGIAWEPLPGAPVTVYTHPTADRYAPITGSLVEAIRENKTPVVSLDDGRAALEMVSAVFAAHISGTRVDMPLKDRRHPLAQNS